MQKSYSQLRPLLLIMALVLVLCAAVGCRKSAPDYQPLTLQWRLEPARLLRIEAKIRDNLKITSRLYQGAHTEVITYGLQAPGQKAVTQEGGTVTIEADAAELYISEKQAIEVTGAIDRGIQMLNHRASVTVRGRNINALEVRNQKNGLKVEGVENVRVLNHAGSLDVNGCGGRLEAVNVEGTIRASSVLGTVDVANLAGDFIGQGLGGAVLLSGLDGNTSVTGTGDITLINFAIDLAQDTDASTQTRNALAAKGKSVRIRTTGRARLENVFLNNVAVEAFGGIEIVNLVALRAEAAGAGPCRLMYIQSPLALRGCSGGVLKDLKMDYELTDCAELMVHPGGEVPPQGVLRGCRNLVFWDTPMGTVTQEHSQNVIFAQREEGTK